MRIMRGGSSTVSSAAIRSSARRIAASTRHMRRQHHRHRLARGAAALDHRLHRNVLVAQRRGNIGDDPGLIDDHQADVIGALMALHRRAGQRGQRRGRHPERRARARPAAMSTRSAATEEAVGKAPAPRPSSTTRPTKSPSATTALNTPSTAAIGVAARHHARVDALFEPVLGQARDAEQLDAIAELLGEIDVEPRDVADALGVDAGEIDRPAERDARQDRQLVRGVDAVDVEARIGFGVAELLRFASTSANSRPLSRIVVRM